MPEPQNKRMQVRSHIGRLSLKAASDPNKTRALRRLEALYRAATTEEDRMVIEGDMEGILMHRAVRRYERSLKK